MQKQSIVGGGLPGASILKMQKWRSPQAPATINPQFFDPIAMFPPIVIPQSWNEPYFFPRVKHKRTRKRDTTRRIYLIRNGEAADLGGRRPSNTYRKQNVYSRMDTNQALVTVNRSGSVNNYLDDPPLTQIGHAGSELVGRSLSDKNLNIHTIYTSPSLRCIQTATAIISAMNCRKKPRLRIEPALFEPLSFVDKVPNFLTKTDLIANNIKYDEHYHPIMSTNDLKSAMCDEKRPADIVQRIEKSVNRILSGKKQDGGILVISHASVLDTVYRIITERADWPRTMGDMQRLVHHYPRCSVTVLQYEPGIKRWENRQNIIPPIAYWHASTMVNVPDFY